MLVGLGVMDAFGVWVLRVTFVLGWGLSVESAVVVEHREVKVAVVLPVRTQHLHIHSQPSEREMSGDHWR